MRNVLGELPPRHAKDGDWLRSGLKWALLWSVLLGAWALQVACADAKLLGFDEPTRIPDSYMVVLNDSLPWHRKLSDGPLRSDDPEVDKANGAARQAALEADAQIVDGVARELASTYHGILLSQFHTVLRGFTVKMSEEDVKNMAKDTRIDSITADHIIGSVWGNQ